jgi:hypothetical protein
MRSFGISGGAYFKDSARFQPGQCNAESYKRVRHAMYNADKPMHKRPVRRDSPVGGYNAAIAVPDEIREVQRVCSEHWSRMFFLGNVSWVDLDDDKLPNTAKIWDAYGIKRIPTKDNKLKPVVHVVASVSTGLILSGDLEESTSSVSAIVEHAALRLLKARYRSDVVMSDAADLVFFIDREYIILVKDLGANARHNVYNRLELVVLGGNTLDAVRIPNLGRVWQLVIVQINPGHVAKKEHARPMLRAHTLHFADFIWYSKNAALYPPTGLSRRTGRLCMGLSALYIACLTLL